MQTSSSIQYFLQKIELTGPMAGWKFKVHPAVSGWLLQVVFTTTCTATGQTLPQGGRKWYISHWATNAEVVQTALKAVLTAMEHEVRESFLYAGRAIYGPHQSLD